MMPDYTSLAQAPYTGKRGALADRKDATGLLQHGPALEHQQEPRGEAHRALHSAVPSPPPQCLHGFGSFSLSHLTVKTELGFSKGK